MSDMSDHATPAPVAAAPAASSPPSRRGPFGEIAPGARLTYVWASPIAAVGIYLVSAVPALIVVFIAIAALAATSGVDQEALSAGEVPPDILLISTVVVIIVQFPVWALFIIAWVKGFERRSLKSAGFVGARFMRNYGVGLAAGLAIALALALLTPLVEPDATMSFAGLGESRVLSPEWLFVLVGMSLLFLVQSSCEEIAFRGWMMSAVAARRGVILGIVMNSLVFGALHAHVFGSGIAAGLAAILAITAVGVFMSVWAVAEGSVAGVCGVHGGFNATLVFVGLLAGAAADPAAGPGVVLAEVLREATAMEGEGSVPGALLQLAAFGALAALVWWRFARRRSQL